MFSEDEEFLLAVENWLLENGSVRFVCDHKTNRKSIWWSGEIHRNTSCVIRQNSFASLLWTCTLFTILIEVWKRKNGRFPCCVFIFFILYTYICHERLSLKCHKLHRTKIQIHDIFVSSLDVIETFKSFCCSTFSKCFSNILSLPPSSELHKYSGYQQKAAVALAKNLKLITHHT